MTYVKYEQKHLGDERWIDAGADAFAVHTWAMAYCDEQDDDGVISRRMARRVAFPVDRKDADAAIDTLIELGFWADNGDGTLTILEHLEHILSAEEKEKTRAKWAADKKRRNLCAIGNHELCGARSKCGMGGGNSTKDSTSGTTSGSTASIPNPTRPDQTPVGGSGLGMGDAHARRPAPGSAVPDADERGRTLVPAPPDDPETRLGIKRHPITGLCCPWGPEHPIHQGSFEEAVEGNLVRVPEELPEAPADPTDAMVQARAKRAAEKARREAEAEARRQAIREAGAIEHATRPVLDMPPEPEVEAS